jgi:excisionase family DNA binding protein
VSDKFMTVHEAAAELKVSRWMIYQLIWANEVQSVTVGRCRRIVRESFDAYVSGLIADTA